MAMRDNRQVSMRRVVVCSAMLILAVVAGMILLAYRDPGSVPVATESPCRSIPSNVEHLGAALREDELTALNASDAIALEGLRPHLRPGDTVHRFETGVTGGLIAIRGDCYVAQHTTWIR